MITDDFVIFFIVSVDKDLLKPIPREIYSDLVDHDNVRCFRIQNSTSFCSFKEQVAEEFGVPVQYQRFWLWEKRQNRIYRLRRPLTPEDETQSLRELSNEDDSAELKLFLEVEFGPDLHPIRPPRKTKEDILLFFKLYDPIKEELSYVGRMFVKSGTNIWSSNIYTKLYKLAGFSQGQEADFFKDVNFEPTFLCKPFDKTLSFGANQVADGDILYFQKSPVVGNWQQFLYPDVPSFLEFLHNRKVWLSPF
ncbi:ubiquitinyl hydrolase 1 [Ranunculus cassubicifolius]